MVTGAGECSRELDSDDYRSPRPAFIFRCRTLVMNPFTPDVVHVIRVVANGASSQPLHPYIMLRALHEYLIKTNPEGCRERTGSAMHTLFIDKTSAAIFLQSPQPPPPSD